MKKIIQAVILVYSCKSITPKIKSKKNHCRQLKKNLDIKKILFYNIAVQKGCGMTKKAKSNLNLHKKWKKIKLFSNSEILTS